MDPTAGDGSQTSSSPFPSAVDSSAESTAAAAAKGYRVLTDGDFPYGLPVDYGTQLQRGTLVYPNPPSIACHPPWPKLLPPQLVPSLLQAVTARDATAWSSEAQLLYDQLTEEQWQALEADYYKELAAGHEWLRRSATDRKLVAEVLANGPRCEQRVRDCLAIRQLWRALFCPPLSPAPPPEPEPEPTCSTTPTNGQPQLDSAPISSLQTTQTPLDSPRASLFSTYAAVKATACEPVHPSTKHGLRRRYASSPPSTAAEG